MQEVDNGPADRPPLNLQLQETVNPISFKRATVYYEGKSLLLDREQRPKPEEKRKSTGMQADKSPRGGRSILRRHLQ